MKSLFFTIALLFTSMAAKAEIRIKQVELGVDGLTCSQCSRSVELSVRKLDFVSDVQMDLENTNGIIKIKNGKDADLYAIAKAVKDAGFSVRYLTAVLDVDEMQIENDSCIVTGRTHFQIIEKGEKKLAGEVRLKAVGKEFMASTAFRKWKNTLPEACHPSAVFVIL